jgi:hypothetical protein
VAVFLYGNRLVCSLPNVPALSRLLILNLKGGNSSLLLLVSGYNTPCVFLKSVHTSINIPPTIRFLPVKPVQCPVRGLRDAMKTKAE